MKPVRCSWVEMQKVRAALSKAEPGAQAAYTAMRCVDKSTVSSWKAVCDLLSVIDDRVEISQLSSFQPSHAIPLVRKLRRDHGNDPVKWPADEVVDWVDRCESESLTVEQFAESLREDRPPEEFAFVITDEFLAIRDLLSARLGRWPPEHRPAFVPLVLRVLEQLESPDVDDGGSGSSRPAADAGAA